MPGYPMQQQPGYAQPGPVYSVGQDATGRTTVTQVPNYDAPPPRRAVAHPNARGSAAYCLLRGLVDECSCGVERAEGRRVDGRREASTTGCRIARNSAERRDARNAALSVHGGLGLLFRRGVLLVKMVPCWWSEREERNAHRASPPASHPIETDVMKMLMSDYEVSLVNDNMQEFYVRFHGPSETPFAGGVWKIHVELPDQYPFKSPSIGFMNKIYHPNIDELSGSVCLDVINQTWSPMFDMINIFEVFLPQLLRYPNPNDPLNTDAAALLMRHPKEYDAKVKEYVQRYATKEAADAAAGDAEEEEDADEEMSDVGSMSDGE
nr:predicted protein [Mycena chlorophos]